MNILRDITTESQKYWDREEILIFIGPRQAGKTFILKQIKSELEKRGSSCFFLDLEDPEYLGILNQSPKNLFKIFTVDSERKNFIFIDEIQYLDNPSNFLKYIFDEHRDNVKLIVSGSSAFYLDRKFKDSLAGRKKIFNIFTLSFREFLRFKKEDFLAMADFDKIGLEEKNRISLYYREFMVFGGYPRAALAPLEEKKEILKEIAYSYIKKDIYEANIRQDEMFYKLFKILASQIGNLVNASELASTLNISKTAIDNYLYVMQKSFHLALIKPFYQNVRKEITKMPKIYFFDMGLRNFFLDDFSQFETRNDKGQLLENAVFRQLLEKYDADEIKFWRTADQKEIDFVAGDSAFEVKADSGKAKEKKYKLFLENYPDKKLSFVSIDSKTDFVNSHQAVDVWDV